MKFNKQITFGKSLAYNDGQNFVKFSTRQQTQKMQNKKSKAKTAEVRENTEKLCFHWKNTEKLQKPKNKTIYHWAVCPATCPEKLGWAYCRHKTGPNILKLLICVFFF